jgi:hypothetical protein
MPFGLIWQYSYGVTVLRFPQTRNQAEQIAPFYPRWFRHLAAGRVWQKLHLSATTRGLAMQPLNQPIEMIDRERQTGQGHQWAKAHCAPDRRQVASHVLVSRRLRVTPSAAEPEAEAPGCRVGVTRPRSRTVQSAGSSSGR